jgi:hypothetical protein
MGVPPSLVVVNLRVHVQRRTEQHRRRRWCSLLKLSQRTKQRNVIGILQYIYNATHLRGTTPRGNNNQKNSYPSLTSTRISQYNPTISIAPLSYLLALHKRSVYVVAACRRIETAWMERSSRADSRGSSSIWSILSSVGVGRVGYIERSYRLVRRKINTRLAAPLPSHQLPLSPLAS